MNASGVSALQTSSPDATRALAEQFRATLCDGFAAAHDLALGTLSAEGSDALDQSKPIKAAIYRSVRSFRVREPELRMSIAGGLAESFVAALGGLSAGVEATPSRLSLMSDSELEQSVLIIGLAGAIENQIGRVHRALVDAVARSGAANVLDVERVFSPKHVIDSYVRAVASLDLEPEVLACVLRALRDSLGKSLVAIYRRAAALYDGGLGIELVEQLPATAPASGGMTGTSSDDAAGTAELTAGVSGQIVSELIDLLVHRARAERSPSTRSWERGQLDELLVALQRESVEAAALQPDGENEGLVQFLENELYKRFGTGTGLGRLPLPELAAAFAELVDAVFQYLLEAKKALAPGVVASLGRLRIPYLRAVIANPKTLTAEASPARLALESLVQMALDCTTPNVPPPALLALLERSVLRILGEYQGEDAVFVEVHAAITEAVTRSKSVDQRREQRAIDKKAAEERLQSAWSRVSAAISELLRRFRLPRLVVDLLERPWAQYMVLCELRGGEDCADYNEAMRAALVVCDVAASEASERGGVELARALASTAGTFRKGLEQVGYHAEDVQQVWRDLSKVLVVSRNDSTLRVSAFACIRRSGPTIFTAHRAAGSRQVVGGEAEAATVVPSQVADVAATPVAPASAAGVTGSVGTALPEEICEALKRVVGRWFVSCLEDGSAKRHKLVWWGRFQGRVLCVDEHGRETMDVAGTRFVELWKARELVLEEETPMLTEALSGVHAHLIRNRA